MIKFAHRVYLCAAFPIVITALLVPAACYGIRHGCREMWDAFAEEWSKKV